MSKPRATEAPSPRAVETRTVQFFCDYYLVEVHAGVIDYARSVGWLLYDGRCYDLESTYSEPSDGIVAIVARPKLADWLKAQSCPIVRMLSTGIDLPFPAVESDAGAIGMRAAEHLLTLGSPTNVFYRTWLPTEPNETWDAFAKTLRAAGRSAHLVDFTAVGTVEGREHLPRRERWNWLKEQLEKLPRPQAVYVTDDRYVNDLFQAAAMLGWRIPEDLAILGTDNRSLVLAKLPIPVSSVDSNLHAIGWAGAALLDRLMKGEAPPAAPTRIAPGRVVPRNSTAAFFCEHPAVSEAMKFVRTHFHEPIHLDDIARAAGLSARVLQLAFKAHVNHTVSDELARVRLMHAARLLRETDLKLESVAHEAGLRNAKYLCEVFRPAFDTTPTAYREAQRMAGKRVPVQASGF